MFPKHSWITILTVFWCTLKVCSANDTCYPAGGVAGIVIATIIVTAVVTLLCAVMGWRIWKRKKVRKKQPDRREQAPKSAGDFAFDNPYFRDQECDEPDSVQRGKGRSSINNKSALRTSKQSDMAANKGKKAKGAKGHFIFGGGGGGATGGGKKQRTMDDTYLAAEPERTVVALKGHDFTGLGFNICGNMRDGILVKDVLHRGPASESGRIKAGDRIISVTVSFTNIVYEDALTILSYASPYDVQLELERTPDKTSNMEESPAGSKRLGSGSFSNNGPKLFHPLYRSQSIDDLTQIDKDTFPSHGLGPRRSQSVGVAAHKLAAHFKNSDMRLEDKNKPSTSVILSTTGSLNEKMLANVMADGALHKCGLQWEKRFEDNLDDDVVGVVDKTIETSAVATTTITKAPASDKNTTIPKVVADNNNDKAEPSEEGKFSSYKKFFRGSKKRNSNKHQVEASSGDANSEVHTTAQVHHQSVSQTKAMSEASSVVWHLDQAIRDADSDDDSTKRYPWNGDVSSSHKNTSSRSQKVNSGRKSTKDTAEESDMSGDDSIDGEKRHRKKKERPPSPDEVTVSKNSNVYTIQREQHLQSTNDQRTSRNTKKTTDASAYKEQNISSDYTQDNKGNDDKYVYESSRNSSAHISGSTSSHLYNKEKRVERIAVNTTQSPINSSDSYLVRNESPYMKVHATNYSPQINPSESQCRSTERAFHAERQDVHPRKYIQNNANCDSPINNRGQIPSHQQYQQRPHYTDYQKSPHAVEQYHRYEEDVKRMEQPRSGPPSYYQALRKANPAGMFTQINPFQQPSNRQRNFVVKPPSTKELNVNGNDGPYSLSYPKSVQVTTSDSSGRPRSRMEPPPYPQAGRSKTVLISTFENNNNSVNPAAINFRQMRK